MNRKNEMSAKVGIFSFAKSGLFFLNLFIPARECGIINIIMKRLHGAKYGKTVIINTGSNG